MQTPTLTGRRRVLLTAGSALALGATGLVLSTEPANAEITLGDLAVPDETLRPADGQVYRPWLVANGRFVYSNLDTAAEEWQAYLLVGDGEDNWSAIGVTEGSADGTSGDHAFQLRGAITAAGSWDASQFAVKADGSAKTLTVPVAIMGVVRDAGNSIMLDAKTTTTVSITVEAGGATANVGASGAVEAQYSSEDPTPTLSGGS